jgi:hypothetical protein
MCSNDDKSCYDRIVHSIASIIMKHHNFSASACICVFSTLQNLHHTVRTIYGDSKSGYGGTLWDVPYSGVGQGNGAGPAIWAVMSTKVLKMMKDEGFGFMYNTIIKGKQLHLVRYSFVDDTDIIQYGQPGEPFQVLATRIQAAMDTWQGGRTTGYRRSIRARKVILVPYSSLLKVMLVPDPIMLEERTVGLCFKRGYNMH